MAADRNLVGAAKNLEEGRKGMTPEGYRDSYWGKENALEFVEVISQALHTERHVLEVYRCGEGPLFTPLESRFYGMNYVTISKKKAVNLSSAVERTGAPAPFLHRGPTDPVSL